MKFLQIVSLVVFITYSFSCNKEFTTEDRLTEGLQSNNFSKIESSIDEKPSLIKYVDLNNNSLMHHAIINENDSLFKYLIERDAPLNIKNNLGKTPLFYLKDPKNMGKLVLSGANVKTLDSLGNSLYHAYNDKHLLVRFIDLANQEINIDKRNKKGLTALMQAIINDEFLKVQILVNKYADVRSTNSSGLNCVQIAKDAGNYKIYEYVKNTYDEISNFSKLKVRTIHSETVRLSGENVNTPRSFALSEVNIPKDCDELIFIGYGKSEKAKILKNLDQLIDIGTTLYGEEAEKAYEKFKKFNDSGTNECRVDFFLVQENDGELIRSDPDYINTVERFASADNVSSFSLKLEREVNFPPENKFIKVIKNEDGFSQAVFTTQIVSVTFPRDDYEDYASTVKIRKDKVNENSQLTLNPFKRGNRPVEVELKEPVTRKVLIPSSFYRYPNLNIEDLSSIYFVQGGAKRTLNEAEMYASLYSKAGFNVWILKKHSGDYQFKILIDHLNDKELANEKVKLVRRKYRKYGDLSEAYVVTRSLIID